MPEFSQLAVMSDGNTEQTIDVLFQEEAYLDVTVPLFYVNSGKKELHEYVEDVCKPQLNDTVSAGKENIRNYVETAQKPALDDYTAARKSEIAEYVAEVSKPDIENYVETEVKPHSEIAKNSAASASASEQAAKESETNAASSEAAAAASAAEAKQYRDEAGEIVRPTQATKDKPGIAAIATAEEVAAGTNDEKIITPLKAAGHFQSQTAAAAEQNSRRTNCLLEVPQNIKLELNNGTLTLKAGSKIYIPNGFEEDGTTLKFDEIVVESNVYSTYTGTTTSDKAMLFYNVTANTIILENLINIASGTETSLNNKSYYNTETNIINRYALSTSAVEAQESFPFCLVTYGSDHNGIGSIDQIFNGVGYIGSVVFALPGLKGLIPDGRNADGTLRNIEYTLSKVVVQNDLASGYRIIQISNVPGLHQPLFRSYREYDTKAEMLSGPECDCYVQEENRSYYYKPSAGILNTNHRFNAGISIGNGTSITSVMASPFNIADDKYVVHKYGPEIISGDKTHLGILTAAASNQPAKLLVQSLEIVIGTKPAGIQRNQIGFYDKNGQVYGLLETNLNPAGDMRTVMAVRAKVGGSYASVWVAQDSAGGQSLRTNCTPPVGDNSDWIPTTQWVHNRIMGYLAPRGTAKTDIKGTDFINTGYTAPYDGVITANIRPGNYTTLRWAVNGEDTCITWSTGENADWDSSCTYLYLRKGETAKITGGSIALQISVYFTAI